MLNRFVSKNVQAVIFALAVYSFGLVNVGVAQETEPKSSSVTPPEKITIASQVLGYGVGSFTVGEQLFQTDFLDAGQWSIQVEEKDEPVKERVEFHDGMLDLYMPARGCTAWLKQTFSGPISIAYQVKCPLETIKFPEVQARDVNSFWHCSGVKKASDLFDGESFAGGFGSYHKMQGWYASTGGGGKKGNRTTRFRRYPREIDDVACLHIALDDNVASPIQKPSGPSVGRCI